MDLVRQRTGKDCAAAAIATFTGIPYENVLSVVGPGPTRFRAVQETLHRLVGRKVRPIRCRSWDGIPGGVIVSVRWPGAKRGYHWLVKHPDGDVLCPLDGRYPADLIGSRFRIGHYLVEEGA